MAAGQVQPNPYGRARGIPVDGLSTSLGEEKGMLDDVENGNKCTYWAMAWPLLLSTLGFGMQSA